VTWGLCPQGGLIGQYDNFEAGYGDPLHVSPSSIHSLFQLMQPYGSDAAVYAMALATSSTTVASTRIAMAVASPVLVLWLCITITVPVMGWELVAGAGVASPSGC
jgi:hypothetical protein